MKIFASFIACLAIFIGGGCTAKLHQEEPITLTDIVNDVEAHGVPTQNTKDRRLRLPLPAEFIRVLMVRRRD